MVSSKISAAYLEKHIRIIYQRFFDGREELLRERVKWLSDRYLGPLPAFLHVNFQVVLKKFGWDHNEVALMTDKELKKRIFIAKKRIKVFYKTRGDVFQKKFDRIYNAYMRFSISSEEFSDILYELESEYPWKDEYTEKYLDEMRMIFNGYFYGRDTISQKIVTEYESVILKCLEVKMEDYYERYLENSYKVPCIGKITEIIYYIGETKNVIRISD